MNPDNTPELKADGPLAFNNRAHFRKVRRHYRREELRMERRIRGIDKRLADPAYALVYKFLRAQRHTTIKSHMALGQTIARIDAAPRGYSIPEEVTE